MPSFSGMLILEYAFIKKRKEDMVLANAREFVFV